MKNLYLIIFAILTITSCSDTEERYLGSWDTDFISINGSEPWACELSWAYIFKLENGGISVELRICNEDFFFNTNNYNYNTVEFGFVDRPTIEVEIIIEGSLEYIDGGELELQMIRDIYVNGFIVSGTDYFAVFE